MKWRTKTIAAFLATLTAAIIVWRPWHPKPTDQFLLNGNPTSVADPSHQVTIVWVNRSGSPCTVMIDGKGPDDDGRWWFALPDGEARPRFITTGPYTLNAVVIERSGVKARHEAVVSFPPGTAHEICIESGDVVQVVSAQR